MRIITLIENLADKPGLIAEHGLAFYVESEDKKILFDTGQSSNFLANAIRLGINVAEIDSVVLSHGHYDHTGGLYPFLENNSKAIIYAKKEAFQHKLSGEERFIGISYNSVLDNRIVFVSEKTQIDKDVFIMPEIPIKYKEDTHFKHFNILEKEGISIDEFHDELYLAITYENKLSVISSCSHNGITNILDDAINKFALPLNLVLGGFHIKDCSKKQSESLIKRLKQYQFHSMGVCHCTGVERFAELKKQFKSKVFYNSTGHSIRF